LAARIERRRSDLNEEVRAAEQEHAERRRIAERIGPGIKARFARMDIVEICRTFCAKSRIGRTPDKNNLSHELRRCMALYHPDSNRFLPTLEKQVEAEEIFKNLSAIYNDTKQRR